MIELQHLHHLQDLDAEIEAKLSELGTIEASLGETDALSTARGRVESLRGLLHDQEVRLRELEWDSEKANQHISDDEKQLYGGKVRNPKELDGLQKNAQQYRTHLREIEERELQVMADVETLQADLRRAQDELAATLAAWETEQRSLSARQSAVNAELAELRARRSKLTPSITSPSLAEYERLRREKRGRAVSHVDRGTCQGCRIALPMGVVSRVRAGRELVHCPSCGRILYL